MSMPASSLKSPAPPGPARAYHHGDLYHALLDAARRLIEEKGPDSFTMKDASRMAGVSVAAPYRHFKDKDALLHALTEQEFKTRFEVMTAIKTAHPEGAVDAIIAMGQSYVDRAVEQPGLFHLIFGVKTAEDRMIALEHSEADKCFQTLVDAVAAFLHRNGGRSSDLMGLVVQLWSIVHGAASLRIHENFQRMAPDTNTDRLVDSATRSLLTGYLAELNLESSDAKEQS